MRYVGEIKEIMMIPEQFMPCYDTDRWGIHQKPNTPNELGTFNISFLQCGKHMFTNVCDEGLPSTECRTMPVCFNKMPIFDTVHL